MLKIMADNDVVGHLQLLLQVCESSQWLEIWQGLDCHVLTFGDLGLEVDDTDLTVWQACQDQDVVLVTGNRNAEGPESLEITIRRFNEEQSLPVLTIADPDRIVRDRWYLEQAGQRLLEILFDLESLRGTGRIYLP